MSVIISNVLETGKRYMFVNRYNTAMALNVWFSSGYPAGNTSNVCLLEKDETDTGQQWVISKSGDHYIMKPQANTSKALDLFTGSGTGSNENAHIYTPSDTSYLIFTRCDDRHDAVKIQLAGPTKTNYYLVANTNGEGTRTGKSSDSTGNVYFSATKNATKGDWIVIDLDADSGNDSESDEYLYEINNVGLPLVDCPVGSYWTNSGNPTDADGTDSKSYNGIQCAGFARYVYAQIWGSDYNGHQFNDDKDYLEDTTGQGDLDDFPLGTRIVCTVRKSFTPGTDEFDEVRTYTHQMILVAKTPASVTFYHANWDNKCGIAIDTWTNSQFYNRFKEIKGATFIPY